MGADGSKDLTTSKVKYTRFQMKLQKAMHGKIEKTYNVHKK
jgi:hypothetical protein